MIQNSHANFINNKVFGGLDGLRFFSILAVVWHHSPDRFGAFKIETLGFLGVDLFFVISGFLIVTLLLRERDLKGTISLKNFYIRRSLRIFPLYYGFLFALSILYLFFNEDSENAARFFNDLPFYLLYLANSVPIGLGVLWSLSTEEQFYLVWPFIEKYLNKNIYSILLFALVANQLINFYSTPIFDWLGHSELKDLSVMQTTFTPILLGVSLAHILHHQSSFKYVEKLMLPSYNSVIWLSILIFSCFLLPDDISGLPRLFIQIIMMLLIGSVVINEKNKLQPILRVSFVKRVGVISYGVYLFHTFTIAIAEKALHLLGVELKFSVFFLGFGLAILAAEVSYRYYEKPFLVIKAKLSSVHQMHA